MTVRKIPKSVRDFYEGLSTDVKPTGVLVNARFREQDTGKTYITFDGNTWTEWDATIAALRDALMGGGEKTLTDLLAEGTFTDRVGAVDATPGANTVLDRLKAVKTAVDALTTQDAEVPTGSWMDAEIEISVDDDLTPAVDVGGTYNTLDVIIPEIDSANVQLYVSEAIDGTYYAIRDAIVAGTGEFADAFILAGYRYIKIGTSEAQLADRTFRVRGVK